MRKELDKSYDPSKVEKRLYDEWTEKKYFHADVNTEKEPFTIVMPPPNITGELHMGHALNNVLQDAIIRAKRMQGFEALWIPGTDHAAIATEVKIVEDMANNGITKDDISREAFLERAWDWKDKYGSVITKQLRKLGCSCDWDREKFTMDEGLSKAVLHVFIKLYNKGLIYKGEKLINWCPNCETSISDAEVDHEEINAKLYYLKYKINGSEDFLTFATTRPETMLGDTAVAVNPKDDRYKNLIGKTVTVPIVNREIPIIADEYVEMDFGSGVVKITPGHDPNDFEVGERHNLPIINIFNDNGTINENGKSYEGLSGLVAREKIVTEFEELGLLVKTEDLLHSVGTHGRCKTVVEPRMKLQWFVNMKDMAKRALDVYYDGELKIIPDYYGKVYAHWLENIRDWCISRQLWWGHRIPAYYCDNCKRIIVAEEMPDKCPDCNGEKFTQDPDTLDTWFSSALWPFSTLGWPDKTPELEYFFPTNVLVTAVDIIFFWVARMVFSSLEQMDMLPFTDVLINGLVRDDKGKKMSKSIGNGIDPLVIIDKYGCDALRLTLLTGNSPGNDMRFSYDKLEADRSFLNKIWNATRFILMHLEDNEEITISENELTTADKWIISKVNNLAKNVTDNIDKYELGVGLQNVYDFIWDEYCDWYIEMVKPRLYNKDDKTRNAALHTLREVLIKALKLLHPFLPFISEEIFTSIQNKEESIMISDWVWFDEKLNFEKEEKEIEAIKEAVKSIRNIRSEMNVVPSKKANVYVVSKDKDLRKTFEDGKVFFKTLSFAEEVFVKENNDGIEEDSVSAVIKDGVIYLPFAELVDIEKEKERLTNETKKLEDEVFRAEKKLSNKGFISKAPESVIKEEQEKLEKYINMLEKTKEELNKINNK